MKLLIGNRNYSSWSLRPWLAMRAGGIAFETELMRFDEDAGDWKARYAAELPAARVPVLIDGDVTVWDSLAIIEYAAERFPDAQVWPSDRRARAHARAASAEMHSGFWGLRTVSPMNMRASLPGLGRGPGVEADLARLETLWTEARGRFGAAGPYLYGEFSAADAMYAPVASRLRTYAFDVSDVAAAWIDAVHTHPAFMEWRDEALREPWVVPEDEVDREEKTP